MAETKIGELRVWWIPQVPMKPFHVGVKDLEQGTFLLRTLADYDLFQYENKVKPDYCNAGGLQVYVGTVDYETDAGWEDWHSEDGDSVDELLRNEGGKA